METYISANNHLSFPHKTIPLYLLPELLVLVQLLPCGAEYLLYKVTDEEKNNEIISIKRNFFNQALFFLND